ncbi:MAG: NAD-dependent epimerase/dehydratase family protein, partial [Steroidobacteraceae bacterium]
AARRGQRVTIVRPCPIYGEGDLRFLKLYRAVARGAFVMIGNGAPRLHLVHIDDLVDGILLCSTSEAALGEVFILGGPEAPTLNELVRHIARALGVAEPRWRIPLWPVQAAGALCEWVCVPLRIEPPLHRRRVGFFTHHREFDCSKAAQLLGYAPRVTPAEGIARTAEWYRACGYLGPAAGRAAQASSRRDTVPQTGQHNPVTK